MMLKAQWVIAFGVAYTLSTTGSAFNPITRLLLFALAVVGGPLVCCAAFQLMHRRRGSCTRQEPLLQCSNRDELTGLHSRIAMQKHLALLLRSASQKTLTVHCLYLDVDSLRHANSVLDYSMGDHVLRQVTSRVAACLHPSDHFSRFGGDKFVVLVHRDISRPELNALAECIVHTVSLPHRIHDCDLVCRISIGIASFPGDAATGETLLRVAERAMHAVKRSGSNSYRYAGQAAGLLEDRRRILAEKLQQVLLRNELQFVYQPIFDSDMQITAAEVLARWTDSDYGAISPAEFIPIAEETGLIVPLSILAMRCACRQMAEWRRNGATLCRIAVNICVLQISRTDFVRTVKAILRETGLPPECLELELTESALGHDVEDVKHHLKELRAMGVHISIDDFGTGYSSFGRLCELNVDTLKIDRIFVQGAHGSHKGAVVLQALIEMAHALNLSVVAEGVETLEQLELLRRLRCNEMQGFLLARPQTPETLMPLLITPGLSLTERENVSYSRLSSEFA